MKPSSLPIVASPPSTSGSRRETGKQQQRRRIRRAKLASQLSLRQHPCFRAFVSLITLQIFILLLVIVFVGDNFEQVLSSRAETIRLIHDYYLRHFRHQIHDDAVPAGIVLDDDDTTKKDNINATASELEAEGDDDLHELEDHIANQTEEMLNQAEEEEEELQEEGASSVEGSVEGGASIPPPPIDNYYARQVQYQKERREDNPFQFLVVGGSDGSGTRAFVTALGKLGVPMIVDDRGTMDVHGKPLFDGLGWPPMVQLVLNHTQSANYKVEDLPPDIRGKIVHELKKLKTDLVKRGERHDSKELRRLTKHHKVNHYDNNNRRKHKWIPHSAYKPQSTRQLREMGFADIENAAIDLRQQPDVSAGVNKTRLVRYGFKAPVTMLLLPFIREVFGPIKFLHVVRDGRDVALSANQSPVRKFYNAYYRRPGNNPVNVSLAQGDTSMNIFAMQLWNDWNSQVLEYERANEGTDFDYMVMRTEDLLSPETKFASLQQLAHFVGSRNSLEELCCQSQQAVVDMGQSTSHMGDGKKQKRVGAFLKHRFQKKPHVYDNLFRDDKAGNHRSDYHSHWKDSEHSHHYGNKHHEYSEDYSLHKHGGIMGGDPILGFIQKENEVQDNSRFDTAEGRHLGWHHGKIDAGSMLEDARERRAQFIQQRHDRFRGIANRLGALKKRRYGPLNPEKGRFKPHQPAHDLQRKRNGEPAQSFADRIAANHRARQQQAPQQDLRRHIPPHHYNDPQSKASGGRDEQRRRLLSSFNKLQIRHVPYAKKKRPIEEGGAGEHAKHRQFKPHVHGGTFLKEMGSPNQESISNEDKDASTTSSSWSLASLGKTFGFANDKQPNPPNRFDQQMLDQFQNMPLLETDARHSHRHFPHPNKRNKKNGNVKERYGKWVSFLGDKPELSQQLHTLGARSLEAFGYEPAAPFLDTSGIDNDFQCDSTVGCKGHKDYDS